MSQLVSIFGFFGVAAAAYGCDRLILFMRMQMAKTFNAALYYPLMVAVTFLFAAILLAYILYLFLWCKKDVAVGVVLLVFSIGLIFFGVVPFFTRMPYIVQPGSYLTFTSAFTTLLGLAVLVLPEKRFGGGRR